MIQKFLDLTSYNTDIRKSRRKTGIKTNEFFTPYELIKKMSDIIPDEDWSNPNKTFLEPCFGNGQFVLSIIYRRLQSGIDLITTLNTLYGIELMQDNVIETKSRIYKLLDALNVQYDINIVQPILDKNLVCSDFFYGILKNGNRIKIDNYVCEDNKL